LNCADDGAGRTNFRPVPTCAVAGSGMTVAVAGLRVMVAVADSSTMGAMTGLRMMPVVPVVIMVSGSGVPPAATVSIATMSVATVSVATVSVAGTVMRRMLMPGRMLRGLVLGDLRTFFGYVTVTAGRWFAGITIGN
jgi:hypothetical protein